MATNFPSGLDSFPRPSSASGDRLNTPGKLHDNLHDSAFDAIEGVEAKVGTTNSTDITSIDYKTRTPIYVSDTQPTIPSGQIAVWLQTGLGADGTDFDLLVSDGS